MFGTTKFSCYSKQILYSHLRTVSGLIAIGLASTFFIDYYSLSGNNEINALTVEEAAFINNQAEEVDLSYYGSIFSNLSRGLPIDDGISNTESPNGEDEGDNSNPAIQEPQQEQE